MHDVFHTSLYCCLSKRLLTYGTNISFPVWSRQYNLHSMSKTLACALVDITKASCFKSSVRACVFTCIHQREKWWNQQIWIEIISLWNVNNYYMKMAGSIEGEDLITSNYLEPQILIYWYYVGCIIFSLNLNKMFYLKVAFCDPCMLLWWHSSGDLDKISLYSNFQSILRFVFVIMHVLLYCSVA